mgnify:CR=1 FL=1
MIYLKFCQEQKFAKFSSKDTGYQLALKVPTTFEIDDTVDENHRGMMRLKFRIFIQGLTEIRVMYQRMLLRKQ